jgi:hypothetical protein
MTVSVLFLPGEEHFSFQTKWMAVRLVSHEKNGQVYQGGLLSDATYQFFKNGYLLTSSMYCKELGRWISVLPSCLRGLSEEHYTTHFRTLFKQFWVDSITDNERETLCWQVVDYSAAQRKGFITAYLDVFNESNPEKASWLLKGCHKHFRAQVTCVKRNCAVLMAHEEVLPSFFDSYQTNQMR